MTGTHARETIITTIDAIHRVTGRAIRLAEVIRVGAASLEFHEETLATETEDHVQLTKEGYAGNRNGPGRSDRDPNRPWRRGPNSQPIDRPTGAAPRTPGVALDEDLRRSRVFRGREPITLGPTPANAPGGTERPTGAVSRPGREGGRDNDGGGGRGQWPGRGRQNPGDTPVTPSGNDQPPVAQQPQEKPSKQPGRIGLPNSSTPVTPPQTQPGNDQPPVAREPETREKPSKQPGRIELPRTSTPTPRTEPPSTGGGTEPKGDQPATPSAPPAEAPRSEPRRTETPRNEERERREMPSRPSRTENYEPPERPSRSELPRSESPRSESPRSESRRSESPRSESPRSESPRPESPRSESPRSESPRSES